MRAVIGFSASGFGGAGGDDAAAAAALTNGANIIIISLFGSARMGFVDPIQSLQSARRLVHDDFDDDVIFPYIAISHLALVCTSKISTLAVL